MAGNRVEELEQTVRELEATVSGLTDELVETKERLRTVEDGMGTDIDDVIQGQATRSAARERTGVREPVAGARQGAGQAGRQGGQQGPVTEGPPSQEKVEQAVEAADGEASADEDKGDEVEGEDDGSETDDIIVA